MRKSHGFLVGLWLSLLGLGAGILVAGAVKAQSGSGAQDESRATDEAALRTLVMEFTKAFNAGDSQALAALFSEKSRIVTIDGVRADGRETIEKQFAAAFAEAPGQHIEVKTESIRFLGSDAAIEDGTATITTPGTESEPAASIESTRYATAYVKREGKWLHDSIRDYPLPSESSATNQAHEHLKQLAGLVGEWIDESDEAEVHTSCRWAENQSFLLRTFRMKIRGQEAMVGTQRVGWDPRLNQIRSWVFDSDGGTSEGLWSRDGDRWMIKTSGTLIDGRTASATNILRFINQDTIKWASVDRTLGAEILPDGEEITLVRKPPAPRAAHSVSNPKQPVRTQP